jgi:hypothetical protein
LHREPPPPQRLLVFHERSSRRQAKTNRRRRNNRRSQPIQKAAALRSGMALQPWRAMRIRFAARLVTSWAPATPVRREAGHSPFQPKVQVLRKAGQRLQPLDPTRGPDHPRRQKEDRACIATISAPGAPIMPLGLLLAAWQAQQNMRIRRTHEY